MKEFLKKYTKELLRIALIIEIIALFGLIEFYFGWFGLRVSVDDKSEEVAVIIYRNRGFALAAIIGIGLAIWGRSQTNKQIELNRAEIELSRKANASERYENAARMLGDQVLAVRIAGCHALENLATDDEKMTTQCIQLLSTFIVNPFVDKNEKDKDETDKKKTVNKPIKQDTQAALNGLSAISRYYYEKSRETVLDKADLIGADLIGADLRGAHLRGAHLRKADLRGAHLLGAHLIGAHLWKADLRGAHLRNANLTKADLIQANLTKAYLAQANLTDADLSGADLRGADLWRVNLRGALLSVANLTGANLTEANLAGTDLTDADLSGTNLYRADLTGAYLITAKNLKIPQAISAKFSGETPPKLSEELLQNEEIQKWIKDNISEHEKELQKMLAKYQQENEDL